MASNNSKSCDNCTDNFNNTDRQTVALPCGHNVCVTCFVGLNASESPVCPQCRQSIAVGELPDSSGFVTIRNAEQEANVEETKEVVGETDNFVGCEDHQEPFVYWSIKSKKFYCSQCILTLDERTCTLKRVQDAISLIQKDLQTRTLTVIGGLTTDSTEHKKEREMAVDEMEKIKKIQEEFQKLNTEFEDFIRTVDYHNFKRREEVDLANKIEEQIESIKSADDIASMLKCTRTLEELQISSQIPPKTRPDTFLCGIACTYEEEGDQKVYIKKLQKWKKRPTKLKNRAEGKTKMDAFIRRCMAIRHMVFMTIFKRPHKDAIQN